MPTFEDLEVGDSFDLVSPEGSNIYRCRKISERMYRDERGQYHRITCVDDKVFTFKEVSGEET